MAENGTYSDPRCATCKPAEPVTLGEAMLAQSDRNEPWYKPNPPGWDEVDGVKLPPITWGER